LLDDAEVVIAAGGGSHADLGVAIIRITPAPASEQPVRSGDSTKGGATRQIAAQINHATSRWQTSSAFPHGCSLELEHRPAFGSAYYYPYAYIDAPAPYCEGLTEDGCQLQWQAVRTLEGPTEFVCVAYCPWQ
jgi:hypothetical protein